MLPRFRLANEETVRSSNEYTASHAQYGEWHYFSSTPCTTSMPYFGAFSFGLYSVSTIQVPLQRQQVTTAAITVAIFELLLLWQIALNNKNDNVIRQI